MSDSSFKQTVVGFAQLTDKSKIVFADPETFDVRTIERGILFIYARWSRPAVYAWKTLTTALAALPALEFSVHVVDADDVTPAFVEQQLPAKPHGNGETYWIVKGRIVQTQSKYGSELLDELRASTARLYSG